MKTETKLTIVPAEAECDPDLGEIGVTPPLIPPGQYTVGFVRSGAEYRMHGEKRVLTTFQITDPGDYFGTELFMAIRTSPRRGEKRMAFSAKLTRLAQVALDREPRRDRLTPSRLFKGKMFLGEVRTVAIDYHKHAIPLEAQYSVLRTLTKKVAG
jgi:hypothetical protein